MERNGGNGKERWRMRQRIGRFVCVAINFALTLDALLKNMGPLGGQVNRGMVGRVWWAEF